MSKLRDEPLDRGKLLINTDRNKEYGEPYDNFSDIAAMITAILRSILKDGERVRVEHVAMIMIIVKLSRMTTSPDKFDSWADIAGYVGTGWEAIAVDRGIDSASAPATTSPTTAPST